MRRSRPRRLPERILLPQRDAPTVYLRPASRTNCSAIDLLQWFSMLQDRRGSAPPDQAAFLRLPMATTTRAFSGAMACSVSLNDVSAKVFASAAALLIEATPSVL